MCRVLSFIFYWFGMVRRKLIIPNRWQAVGMHNDGFSHRRVADHFRVNHSIIVRLMQCFRQTRNVTDRPRAGRPHKTTPREDRLISRWARQRPFITTGGLRGNLAFGGHISTHCNQTPPPSGNASATTLKTSTVDITSSPCSI